MTCGPRWMWKSSRITRIEDPINSASTPKLLTRAMIRTPIMFATVVNMMGVRIMARVNNFGVLAELIGSSLLVILLLFHIHRGPQVIVHNLGLGKGHPWGFFGALLIGGIMSAYVMYGFDTAGTLGEETNDPRRAAPPALLRALAAAAFLGACLLLLAMTDVRSLTDPNIGAF